MSLSEAATKAQLEEVETLNTVEKGNPSKVSINLVFRGTTFTPVEVYEALQFLGTGLTVAKVKEVAETAEDEDTEEAADQAFTVVSEKETIAQRDYIFCVE